MRHVLVVQEPVDRHVVDLARHRRVLQDRARLGAEPQFAAAVAVEERLLADAVAADQQAPPPLVPEREGEHSAQSLHEIRSFLLV